jgi:hypothetical protein
LAELEASEFGRDERVPIFEKLAYGVVTTEPIFAT